MTFYSRSSWAKHGEGFFFLFLRKPNRIFSIKRQSLFIQNTRRRDHLKGELDVKSTEKRAVELKYTTVQQYWGDTFLLKMPNRK